MLLVKEEPLYLKLKNNLKELIESHNLTVLPGTKALEKSYGVSRITARRAIAELAKEGIVSSAQGRKVMVTKHMYADVKELGFVISKISPWVEAVFSCFVREALHNNYNLNMFICSYNNNITANNTFNYLLESNKLSGILMMNRLHDKDIKLLLKKKLPLMTYSFKYKNYDIPAVLYDYKPAISQMINYYLKQKINRFAFISFYEKDDDPAYGEGHNFIDSYKTLVKEHNLHDYDIPSLFKHDTEREKLTHSAMSYLHSLPLKQRPQIISVYFYSEYKAVKSYLENIDDWKPRLIPYSESPGNEPRIICSHEKKVKESFIILNRRIKESKELKKNIMIPTKFDSAQQCKTGEEK